MKLPFSSSTLRIALSATAAIAFSLLAVFAADRHVSRSIADQQSLERRPEAPSVSVVVAKFDLVTGEVVSSENMAVRSIPIDVSPGSAVRPDRFESYAGMKLTRPLRGGEPLLAEIVQPADVGGLAMRVRQGIRALTLNVDEVSSVSGMLRPGDRIDLLFTARSPAGGGVAVGESTSVLVQDVPILATGRQVAAVTEENSRGFTSITMELSPDDAKRVVAAQRAGRITAMLRHPDDRQPVSNAPVDLHALLGLKREPAVSLTAPPIKSTGPEIITGGLGPVVPKGERNPHGARTTVEPVPESGRFDEKSNLSQPPRLAGPTIARTPTPTVPTDSSKALITKSDDVAVRLLSPPSNPLLFR
jgi:pilus assembly protein CpaB